MDETVETIQSAATLVKGCHFTTSPLVNSDIGEILIEGNHHQRRTYVRWLTTINQNRVSPSPLHAGCVYRSTSSSTMTGCASPPDLNQSIHTYACVGMNTTAPHTPLINSIFELLRMHIFTDCMNDYTTVRRVFKNPSCPSCSTHSNSQIATTHGRQPLCGDDTFTLRLDSLTDAGSLRGVCRSNYNCTICILY